MRILVLSVLLSAFPAMTPPIPASSPPAPSGLDMRLLLRTRVHPFPGDPAWIEASFEEKVPTAHAAIVITDMWDKHWCRGATERVGQIAQKMEPLLQKARASGILIIHAPSDTMSFYAGTPQRLRAENAPKVIPPKEIAVQQPPLPIDDSDDGCDTPGDKSHRAWSKEISTLKIAPGDVISDSGSEIYNILQQHHIDTVFYMGVHANMCILNRTFGIRQMSKWGVQCVLVRDLTDAMYNPSARPYVTHAAGVALVIQYIEQYAAPTITSAEMLASLSKRIPG
jgi:nicotinamidase-related amidase